MSIGFYINGNDFLLPLHPFAEILRVPCIGACMFTTDWSLGFLPHSTRPSPTYRTTLDDSIVVHDTIFTPRTVFTQRNKGKIVAKDAMQMELNELHLEFKQWERIIFENALSLDGNRDHPNGGLVYILYSLVTHQPFNLTYFIAKRMIIVVNNNNNTVLPYGMLLTRLRNFVSSIQTSPLTDDHHLVDSVMVPLTKRQVYKLIIEGKRPHPPTDSSKEARDEEQAGPSNPIDNTHLYPIQYIDELPDILDALVEFKQTKGMLKCLANFLYGGKKRK
ncbi:hypothetical protein Tco_1351404 [Tanacetum coccineum]